jgi:hypothetical protein
MFPKVVNLKGTTVRDYIENAINGRLYNYIRSRYMEVYGKEITIDQVKKIAVFTPMFGEIRENYTSPFEKMFPQIHAAINHYKAEDYTALSISLQQLEAHLILDKICNKILKNKPQISCLFTVHDSIITTHENEELVIQVMKEEYQKYFGYTPFIRPENWFEEDSTRLAA